MAQRAPFFIGEDPYSSPPRRAAHISASVTPTPTPSRPSTSPDPASGPSPVARPSRPSAGSEPVPRHTITIAAARRDSIPRLGSYYGPRTPIGVAAPTGTASPPASSRASSGVRLRESFSAPPSRPLTVYSTAPSAAAAAAASRGHRRLRSTLLDDPRALAKPWLAGRDPHARLAYVITYAVALLGLAASAVRCYFGYRSVRMIDAPLCLVLDEPFDGDTDAVFGPGGRWLREVQLGGYGNGEFEMTTSSSNNAYVADGFLYITPTLTSDAIGIGSVFDGYTYNLTDCTYNLTTTASSPDAAAYYQACGAVSNSTAGTVIPPVQSARISTRNSASIRYGRVEVRAKLPRGDWLWPAIWMLPVNDTYGPWPMSGEIDLMESRGNGRDYPDQGIDYVRGSLNWGPLPFLNAVWRTFGWWTQRRTDYGEAFHTYVLEWTEGFIRMYVDTRLQYMLQLAFDVPFFTRGDFPAVVDNGTTPIVLENPWANGTAAAPFDQPFYLILSLAAGGTNGWFPDGAGGKPWLDGADTAMRDFARAQDTWHRTWGAGGENSAFVIDYVKMWQLC